MKHTGFYINLDRSTDRRNRIESELARNGLAGYARFAATEGNPSGYPNPRPIKNGEMGCFISHYRLLDENRNSALPLHVIEDDILLSPQLGQVLDWAIASGQLAKFDILLTDVAVPLLNDACHAYKNYYDAAVKRDAAGNIASVAFSAIDMRELIFASTCSFLVNPRSIGKLADLYGQALRAGATLPIDIHIRDLCQKGIIKVGCIFPFVTSIRPESCFETIIGDPLDELSTLAANMLRHSFYIGCDWNECLKAANRLFPQPDSGDIHRQVMLRLMGFSLTRGYIKC